MKDFDESRSKPGAEPVAAGAVKLSDLTVAGWLLVFVSLAAAAAVGIPLLGFLRESFPEARHGPVFRGTRLLVVAVSAVACVTVGVGLFLAGKWLLEAKLKVAAAKRATGPEPRRTRRGA